MGWENKVVWSEGLFLHPQHLQQQDRWIERLLRAGTAGLVPFGWGLTALDIDTDALGLGRFGLRSAAGIFADGTPFAVPFDTDHPRPIELGEGARGAVVHLLLPSRQPGAVEVGASGAVESVARYAAGELEAWDTAGGAGTGRQTTATLTVGRLRLRLALADESRDGYTAIPVARIAEVRPDRAAILDENFIPPVLLAGASPVLAGFATQLLGLLGHRADAIAGRMSEGAARGAAEISDVLMLGICNRNETVLAHLAAAIGQIHPERLYERCLQLAGELATFTDSRKRPPAFPPYRHEAAEESWRPLMAALRQSLSAVLEQTAVPIPLQERKFGIRVGPLTDRSLLANAAWVLAVKAQLPPETLRRNFPNMVKIGPVEQIRELINVALPGIAVRALPVAPRQLPYYAGTTYFELDRSSAYWAGLARSGGIAVHVTGDLPGLTLECWAIREERS